ncbi:MAG: PilZ domain-containing protein [Nitrospira sp.]|nr:MAG: PilZ domain-containing protein [Nitrospira sp.]
MSHALLIHHRKAVMIECREHRRIPVELQVFFSSTNRTEIREGTMFDLSAGGCAVTSMAPIDPGAGLRLLIRATDLGSPITVHSAAVRWANHGEFGVEFLNLSDLDRSRLQRFLRVTAPPSHS